MSYNIKRRAKYYFGKTIRIIEPKKSITGTAYVSNLSLEKLPDLVIERTETVIFEKQVDKSEPPERM